MPIDPKNQFDAAISAGQSALKVAMLINGAAATALLATVGSLYEKDKTLALGIASHLGIFAWGVAAAAMATGITYLTLEFQAVGKQLISDIANWLAVGLVTIAYVLFCLGIFGVSREFAAAGGCFCPI